MLEIHSSHVGKNTIIEISGRIDGINCGLLQDVIDVAIAEEGERQLLLKMTNVNYISAAGLRVLRDLKKRTGSVRIVEPSIRVVDVMQITGLDAVYELYSTLNQALDNLE